MEKDCVGSSDFDSLPLVSSAKRSGDLPSMITPHALMAGSASAKAFSRTHTGISLPPCLNVAGLPLSSSITLNMSRS